MKHYLNPKGVSSFREKNHIGMACICGAIISWISNLSKEMHKHFFPQKFKLLENGSKIHIRHTSWFPPYKSDLIHETNYVNSNHTEQLNRGKDASKKWGKTTPSESVRIWILDSHSSTMLGNCFVSKVLAVRARPIMYRKHIFCESDGQRVKQSTRAACST